MGGKLQSAIDHRGVLPSTPMMMMDFPIGAMPYCVFSEDAGPRRLGVGLGSDVIDLSAAAALVTSVPAPILVAERLNPLLAAGRETWRALRSELTALATSGALDAARIPQSRVRLHLAWDVSDFVDFYSSRHHAENLGRIFRPESDPLPANWLHLPAGYHGRASTVVVDGTPVRRPRGQVRGSDGVVTFRPSSQLDFELEIGVVVGGPTEMGEPVPIDDADDHLFGLVLLNDWSARDIQAWEYVPLGPFLGKSFATSVSAWVMPIDALDSVRRPGPRQDPLPLPHLQTSQQWSFDLDLEVWITPADDPDPVLVSRVNAGEGLYWTMAQQLAHLTSNGARLSTGDLLGSGTVSGPGLDESGSLLELSRGGSRPIDVGVQRRTFLEDGDEVVMRASAPTADGRVQLGSVSGVVDSA